MMPSPSTDEAEMKERTKQFALRAMKVAAALPRSAAARIIRQQLVRSATSVGANYRAACRGRSKAEFIAKLGIVEEEADESAFWLEIIADSCLMPRKRVEPLYQEATELVAIMAASGKTARKGKER